MFFDLLVFFGAGFLIIKSADLFIKGAVEIADGLRLQKVFVAATIVSLVTTMPEFIVSASSSYIGQTGMAVGNAIGSCICNIGLVLAVGMILNVIAVEKRDFIQRMSVLLGGFALISLFSIDGTIDRLDAVILLICLGLYLYFEYRSAYKKRKEILLTVEFDGNRTNLSQGIFLFIIGGIAIIVLARYGLVETGINIANLLNIPPIVIGLTLTALGTSLPELFTTVASSRRRLSEVSLGNTIGASVLNLLWVLGVAALIRPLPIDQQTLFFNLPAAIFISTVLLFLGLSGFKLDRKKGIILLGIYAAYIVGVYLFVYR
ncbi:MAG: calcium/sodium antiporter [Candidatus Margulisbacteria bacterium]|nr:calcium/sodium antiporter [Candidatus Margulisiibacteriota bacterium]